jgi:hypothetical protein
MKIPYFLNRVDANILTNYEIKDDKIIRYYTKHLEQTIPYSKEKEKQALEDLKYVANSLSEYEKYVTERRDIGIKGIIIFSMIEAVFAYMGNLRKLDKVGYISILTLLSIYMSTFIVVYKMFFDDAKLIDKYKYFLENEELINEDILKRYKEFYGDDAPIDEAAIMTINDIDDYNYETLVEMVEAIKNQDNKIYTLKENN